MNQLNQQAMPPSMAASSNRWGTLAILSTISCLLIGGPLVSLSVYIPVLEKIEGWTDAVLGGAGTAMLICSSISGIITGTLIDRYSPRYVILLGGILAGLGCWLAAQCMSPATFIAAFAVIGMGIGAAAMVPSIPVLSNLFGHNRGLALGVYFATMSLGGAILPALSSFMIERLSWRVALQITGVLIILCSLIVLALRIPSAAQQEKAGAHTEVMFHAGVSVSDALRSMTFWILLIALSLSLINVQGVLFAVVAYFVHGGMSTDKAVTIFSITNFFAVPSLFLVGTLADRLGARRVLLSAVVIQAFGTLALLGVMLQGVSGWIAIGTFAIMWGVACGIPAQVGPMLLEDVVGPRHFGALLGVNTAVASVLAALAPLETSVLRGLGNGGYPLVFEIYGVLCLLSAPLIIWIRPCFRRATGALPVS